MAVVAILENRKIAISWPKFDHYAVQGQLFLYQSKAHMRLPISD